MKQKLLSCLGFDSRTNSVKTEMLAGLTTFLTMSYILALFPAMLSETGMDRGAIFTATVLSATVATLIMAFYAKMPFALASGVGTVAIFIYTLVFGMGFTWQQALAAVFVEGVVFIFLTVFKIRDAIVNCIPMNMRYAITAGIGIFIALLGLKNGHIVESNPATIIGLAPWTAESVCGALGIILGTVLLVRKMRGALFFSIIAVTLAGLAFGFTHIPDGFSFFSLPSSIAPIALKMDFSLFLSFNMNYILAVFILLFLDLFDTLGTLIGASMSGGMVDEKGNVKNLNKALLSDAVGTLAGSMLGAPTVTTFVESSSGIAAGGRTGLTSLTTAVLFLTSLLLSPLFLIIPAAATSCVLVLVGVMMIGAYVKINLDDYTESVPCFVTMAMMPFTFSIAEGIVLGMLTYVMVKVFSCRYREVHPVVYAVSAFMLLKYLIVLF